LVFGNYIQHREGKPKRRKYQLLMKNHAKFSNVMSERGPYAEVTFYLFLAIIARKTSIILNN